MTRLSLLKSARPDLLWLAGGAVFLLPILFIIASRDYLTFSTETDLLGGFLPEAQKIIAGQPLDIAYHPPGYAFVLSLFLRVFQDPMTSGMILSALCACLAAFFNYRLFCEMLGKPYGLATLAAFWLSVPLLSYTAMATSDVFFLALFSAAMWLSIRVAARPRDLVNLVGLGLVIGFAYLSRSNALTLFSCFLAPFITVTSLARPELIARLRSALTILVMALAPVMAWAALAAASGMPFMPAGTVDNLAMTYFSTGNGLSMESMDQVKGRFNSMADVLLHDPAHILKSYVADLWALPQKLGGLLAYPVNLFIAPGLFLLMLRANRLFLFYVILLILPQILLVNLKTFEIRFYLFCVPLLMAATFEVARLIVSRSEHLPPRLAVLGVLVALTGIAVLSTKRDSYYRVHAQDEEIRQLVEHTRELDPEGLTIAGRKQHVAYYLDADFIQFRGAGDLDELQVQLAEIESETPLAFYYGSSERGHWNGLAELSQPEAAPDWLTPVARGDAAGGWVLYLYEPDGRASEQL